MLNSSYEIPQYRLPMDVVDFEINLVKDLGVKFETGRSLSTSDITLNGLIKDGTDAIFLGIGLPQPMLNSIFNGLTTEHGFYTSKNFLPIVSEGNKTSSCFFVFFQRKFMHPFFSQVVNQDCAHAKQINYHNCMEM